jgi:predicted dehydrogenase
VKVPPPPGKKLGWALVGLGKLAIEELLPAFALCEHARPTAFVSGHADKARVLAQRYRVPEAAIYSYDTFDKIKDNADVDVVYVVLPNSMHAEYTVRAAEAGKHVFCEKPMATTVEDCRRMIDACRKAGRKFAIGYRMRYEPHQLKAIELIRSGAIGAPRVIVADLTQNQPGGTWRTNAKLAGGGPLPDIGIYCLNACCYLTGEEPVEVRGLVTRSADDPRFREVERDCLFELRFPSGVVASCSCSYDAERTARYRVMGTKGAIDLDPAFPYRGLRMRVIDRQGSGQLELPQVNQFATEMDHFSTCIQEGKDPRTPGEEGLRDVVVMHHIYEAARTGRAIQLPPEARPTRG